jgi:spermidine synthase
VGLLLPAAFTLSGAVALILQVVWVRKLIEVFGSSTLAIATVLAGFMGGLALGAHLGGILADRLDRDRGWRHDPLLYYGAAEAVVGLSALALPLIIESFRGPNAWLWIHLGDSPTLLAMARFGLTGAALLIPTTAMGATLPLLARRVTASSSDLPALGARIGVLYAANTFGALAGAGLAGFALIERYGASHTGHIAAVMAIGLAAAVAVAAIRPPKRRGIDAALAEIDLDEPAAEVPAPPENRRRLQRGLALGAYALSGAVAMGLEVLLARALAVINGSSVYSFTLVLVVFLGGLSVGALAIARTASRTHNPLALLGGLLVATAAAIAVAVWVTDQLPVLAAELLEGSRLERQTIMSVHATITAFTIAPIAACLGAIMPVAIRAYVGSAERVGREVGRAYAANTLGAIVGSVGTGFVLMPAITLEHSMRLFVALDAVAGAALLWIALHRRPRARRFAAAVALAIMIAGILAPRWNRSDFTAGLFRAHVVRRVIKAGEITERRVLFYADGAATTVTVEQLGDVVVMKNNGKVEASSLVDMPTQILVGLLPVLLHDKRDSEVFVIGYGSGVTVGSIARSPWVAAIDVAELEPEVYAAADAHFSDINHAPQSDERVNRLIGDGRNVLLAGGKKYDVIVSEPSNPWIAGVASLFTREFYDFARDHLKEGGMFAQWAQLYELGPRNVKMIYRTFAGSFPYVYAFTPGDETSDTILIGTLEPLELDVDAVARAIQASAAVEAELERAGIERAEQLIGAAFLMPDEVASFTAGAPINTDDNALLEYGAPRDLLASAGGNRFARSVRSPGWPYGEMLEHIHVSRADPAGDVAMARALLEYGRRREARRFADRARSAGADTSRFDLIMALSRPRGFQDPELPFVAGGPALPEPSTSLFVSPSAEASVEAVEKLVAAYPKVASGEWAAAYQLVAALPRRADTDAGRDITLLIGYLAYKSVELIAARDVLRRLAGDEAFLRRRPAAIYYLGRAIYGIGSFRTGLGWFDKLAREHPEIAAEAAGLEDAE